MGKLDLELRCIDFEYPEFMDFSGKDLKDLIDLHLQLFGRLKYIFLDEVQAITNWEKGLRRIHENKEYYIFITGSSAKLLGRELATQLRGRTVSYHLYPLSFREFLILRQVDFKKKLLTSSDKNNILFEFNSYLETGGYPQVILERDLKDLIIRDYKDLVLFRDLVERYGLKNIYVVRSFFEYLISSLSKEISLDRFYNFLKSQNVSLSKKTLYNYLDYFESSLFFHFMRTYKVRERIKKVYLNDVVFGGPDKGRRLENLVYLDLLRKSEKIYCFRGNGECDFVLPGKTAIQVAWELNDENEKREIKGLKEAMEYHRLKDGIILTYDQKITLRDG